MTDVDGRAHPITVLPGELLPFIFDMATVIPFDRAEGVSVTVSFSPSAAGGAADPGCPAISPPPDPVFDPTALYVSVLAALCEPALLDEQTGYVPTSSDIAAQLALSPRAVDAHIDYLIEKFNIPAPSYRAGGWKRSALIAYVRGHESVARALRERAQRLTVVVD